MRGVDAGPKSRAQSRGTPTNWAHAGTCAAGDSPPGSSIFGADTHSGTYYDDVGKNIRPKLYRSWAPPRDTPGISMQGTEAPNRSDSRPNNRMEVLKLLCSIREADVGRDSQILKHWGRDSAIDGLVKYREDLIRQIAANHHTAAPRELPALIARELMEGATAVGRDSSTTLQGRYSRKGGGANPRPADSTLHKQIGSTQKDQ